MRRSLALALVLVVLDVQVALAHGPEAGDDPGGGIGATYPVLGAVVLVAGGLYLRSRSAPAVAGWGLLAAGAALGVAGLLVTGGEDGGGTRLDVHVSILEPASGSTVVAGRPVDVRVAVDGPLASGPSDSGGGHLHLYVDGALQQMPSTARTKVTFAPGRHIITVEYVDHDHDPYEPRVQQSANVIAE